MISNIFITSRDCFFFQKIVASSFGQGDLDLFGYSITGNVDVDDNQYPDVAIGAYASERAVVLRYGIQGIAHNMSVACLHAVHLNQERRRSSSPTVVGIGFPERFARLPFLFGLNSFGSKREKTARAVERLSSETSTSIATSNPNLPTLSSVLSNSVVLKLKKYLTRFPVI